MSFGETIFLFVLALVVFGPKKLPEIARQVGRYLNEFRRASNEFKAQIEQEISHLGREETRKILPPSESRSGVNSRDETTAASEQNHGEAEHSAPDTTATLAVATTESAADAHPSSPESPTATEEGPEAEKVAAPASQESHA